MKAKILPLDGKYYGTQVLITKDDGDETVVNVWTMGNGPSRREIADWHPDEFESYDSHYESADSLRIAEIIEAAINATVLEGHDHGN